MLIGHMHASAHEAPQLTAAGDVDPAHVALFLAHKHLHEHRPDLVARGLPPPPRRRGEIELGAYGVAVEMPAKSAAGSVRKAFKLAFDAGVRDGAVEWSF